jgi:hypothetical protein
MTWHEHRDPWGDHEFAPRAPQRGADCTALITASRDRAYDDLGHDTPSLSHHASSHSAALSSSSAIARSMSSHSMAASASPARARTTISSRNDASWNGTDPHSARGTTLASHEWAATPVTTVASSQPKQNIEPSRDSARFRGRKWYLSDMERQGTTSASCAPNQRRRGDGWLVSDGGPPSGEQRTHTAGPGHPDRDRVIDEYRSH